MIEAIVASFVAADQQDCTTAGIKCKQRAELSASVLRAKFFHVDMLGTFECIYVRSWKIRTKFLQGFDANRDRILFRFIQRIPPVLEFVGIFNFPHPSDYSI